MNELPRLSGRELLKALGKVGFVLKRQHGSHMILRRDDPWAQTVIPDHKELDRGTLRAILRQTEVSVQQLNQLLSEWTRGWKKVLSAEYWVLSEEGKMWESREWDGRKYWVLSTEWRGGDGGKYWVVSAECWGKKVSRGMWTVGWKKNSAECWVPSDECEECKRLS